MQNQGNTWHAMILFCYQEVHHRTLFLNGLDDFYSVVCCHNALLCFSSSLEWVSDFISSLLHGNLFKLKLHQQHWSLFIHYSMAKQMSHYAEICLPRKKKVWESFQWVFVQMCPALLNNLITDLQFRMFNCLYLLYLQFKHLQDLWWDVTRASRSGLGLSEPYKSCKRPARVWEPQRPTSSQRQIHQD